MHGRTDCASPQSQPPSLSWSTGRSSCRLFLKGASLNDPAKIFNSSLDGKARRAIDIHEGDEVDADAFKKLIRDAVGLNVSTGKARKAK